MVNPEDLKTPTNAMPLLCMKCLEVADFVLETISPQARRMTFFHVDEETAEVIECRMDIRRDQL